MLLKKLSHANIIRHVDSFVEQQTNELVLVLEWARGGDLKKLIKSVRKAERGMSRTQ